MRHHHVKDNIAVPLSSENIIIFPVDKAKAKFSLQCYDPAMTMGRISKEEIESFFKEVNPLVDSIFNSQMSLYTKHFQKLHPFVLVFLMALAICAGIPMFIVFPVVFGAFYISHVMTQRINCAHIENEKNLIREAKHKIMPILLANNPHFKRKGYFWAFPMHFPYWIELWVDEIPSPRMRVQYVLQE